MTTESPSLHDLAVTDTQLFHINARYTFHRTGDGAPAFVIKSTRSTPPDPRAVASLRHEYELLQSLDIRGVVKVHGLLRKDDVLAMAMDDAGAQHLGAQIAAGPLAQARFWEVALPLSEALASLHDAGILHCALSPSHIVWDAQAHRPTIIDFGSAVSMSAQAPDLAAPAQFDAALSYMSPEQTGRTGIAVDARSDLYALGAVFYALLTGAPPFATRDPIELIHAHLARRPPAPAAIDATIPAALSDIVLKLLEKEPESRYQSAASLLADLRTVHGAWSSTGAAATFALGEHAVPRRLTVPGTLYGRGAQIDALRDALDRVSRSARELVLVAGAPGIGKSALVGHLEQDVVARHGYFISGKFDQLQRSVPYEGLVQAFRMLVRQLLTEPETALALWRERIAQAVAPNGQILVDVIPEIDRILGPQAPASPLGPVESKNRFNQVFTSFINVFARPGQPFVLFLDDLQWVDAASLQLLQQWIADSASGHLLIVGAYRDEEVGLAHPLALVLTELRKARVRISEIHLAPLEREHVADMLAETLQRERAACLPLAELIVTKTGGNPFFIKRLLHALHGAALIRYAPASKAWEWDIDEMARAPVSDNVLDLMVQAIDRLPPACRSLIQVGACIGYRFDLATLAEVTGHSHSGAMNLLWPAVKDGLLFALDGAAAPVVLQFVHDRVQQAAYKLLPDERRAELHLAIGRHLLRERLGAHPDTALFDVVHQLNRGAAHIADPAERLRLAELNLAAGIKAKDSAAYQAAFDYLNAGTRGLPPDSWTALPELSFALHGELAECAYLTGQHALAEQIVETALQHAPTNVAKIHLYSLRVLAATVAGDWAGALHWGREGLAVFGHAWPLEHLAEANDAESRAVLENLGGRRIDDLVDQPEVTDEETRACMRLLSLLGPPAYFSGSEVLTFLVARSANLSLLHGPSVYSSYGYVFQGALHNARTGEYDIGYAFGKLALALAQRFDNRAEESRTLEVFGLVVHPWKAPLQASLPLLREGHRAGVESGELAYAAFNLCSVLINGLPAGVPLAELLADAAISLEFATRHQNRTAVEISLPFRQFARVMMAPTLTSGSFDDDDFQEARFLVEAHGNQTAIGQYWVARLQAAYLAGDLEAALACSRAGEGCLGTGILGMITSSEHTFYTALTLAAGAAGPAATEQVRALHAQVANWARHCPQNFQHKALLLEAELARMDGAPWQAMTLFGQAIDAAGQAGYGQDAALANELAARLFLAHGQSRLAAGYLQDAIDGYRLWGASAKAHALALPGAGQVAPASASTSSLALDNLGLTRASQAIAAEIAPQRLFERILQIVVEVAGAQGGVLLLGEPAQLRVRGRIGGDGAAVTLEDTPLADCAHLPRAIVRYVARTGEALVLDDAAADGPFAADVEVRGLGLRSVLCVPLARQSQVVGMLYLENNAMTRAFTAERVEVVRALASQAAISLENSTLLLERARSEQDLRQLAENLSGENRRKTEFLATLAHELRNPLAPIRTGLDLLRISGSNPASTARVHEMMGRQLNQMVHLIDDLLDIARVDSGKVHLKKERMELRDAISSAVEAAMPAIKAARHTLDIALPDGPLLLDADPVRMAQVLSNLLTNATKYTPSGGHIKVAVQVAGDGVDIAVTDTGIGIPADAMPEVFTMFSQVSRNMGRSQGGLGIGLSLVRSLVQMHGGTVSAASKGEGHGSTFTLHLPLLPPAPESALAPAAPTLQQPLATPRRLRILVADDNVDAALTMLALLDAYGHDVDLVHDGVQALRQASENDYDLAILDIGMPGLNGHEVAEAIRRLPGRDRIFLAALTGWGAEEDRKRSHDAGFDAHLIKPAGSAEITRLLAAALARG